MKWENFGAFLSWLLRREIILTGFFLSEFHCNIVAEMKECAIEKEDKGIIKNRISVH
jgi:hypothetical protein